MAPNHREDTYVIIQPGELHTLVKFGLEDSLSLPSHSVPTRVFKNKQGNNNMYSMTKTDEMEMELINPIENGKIVDLKALQFLIKSILNSFLKLERYQNIDLDQIHLLIVQSSWKWSHLLMEKLVNYLFEALSLYNVSIIPLGLCSMFSYGSYPNALVIDVGYKKTEILPIVDYEIYGPAVKVVNKGGDNINQVLKRLLPKLSEVQIEDLKKSDIFECLSAEDAKRSFFGIDGLVETENKQDEGEDEGVLDIASIVTSDKSTREILEEKSKAAEKDKLQSNKPNSELEINTFIDSNGNEVEVGKERFQGCKELIDNIITDIYWGLERIPDPKKRQDCYENIIFCGQTTKIAGFKELIMFTLAERYLVTTQKGLSSEQEAQSQFRNNIIEAEEANIKQVPKHLRMLNKPDYFTEWKKHGFEDCSFLGAQILSKQVFHNNSGLNLTWHMYQEEGPRAIWNVRL